MSRRRHFHDGAQHLELLNALVATGCQLPVAPADLCARLVTLARHHPVVERRDQPEIIDHELLGYLQLLSTLLHAHPHLKRPVGEGGFVRSLYDMVHHLRPADEARLLGPSAPPICKSVECRVAALKLLVQLSDGHVPNLTVALELLFEQQMQRASVAASRVWHYMPAAQEKSTCGYVGLKNLGATCYLNSLTQQLFMIPEFRAAVLALPIALPPEAAPSGTGGRDAEAAGGGGPTSSLLLYQLQRMFGYLHESQKKFLETEAKHQD